MSTRGRRIVLAASRSESSEYQKSAWRQMLLATLPAKYARWMGTDWSAEVETTDEGQAKYVPNGLRVIESLLLTRFPASEIAVCYPDQLEQFVGEDTKVIGIHAHNPLGITFATDVYAGLWGTTLESVNAAEFRRLILHPAIARHRRHLKLIVGGPGAWQLETKNLLDEWNVDCLVNGEAEEDALGLFEAALRGETLPRKVECDSPMLESIPATHHRSTLGVVEITRGCGRGCQFCSVALRGGKSIPLDQILENVRRQVAEGGDTITLTTEDLFLYEQGKKFKTNREALKRLFESVGAVPGVRHVQMTHGTIAPVVVEPEICEELSPVAVGKSINRHPDSTHPEKRYAMMFVGLETGSVRLFKQFMKGKGYPFRPEQWPDVVLKGMETMNKHNWFPMATFILGLPGETRQDTRESLDLLHALKGAKWCVIPTLFVPLEDTRMASKESAKIAHLTDLQWEFFFTCWRYNLDFFRRERSVHWKFNAGVPFYYYLMGRRLLGPEAKNALWRLGHVPEWWVSRKTYLDLRREPKYKSPASVPVPGAHTVSDLLPVIETQTHGTSAIVGGD